jgi:hypothetical protein
VHRSQPLDDRIEAALAGGGKLTLQAQTRGGKAAGTALARHGCHVWRDGLQRGDLLMSCKSGRLARATYTFSLPANVASTIQPHVSSEVMRDGGHVSYAMTRPDRRHVVVAVTARANARIDVRRVSISYYVRH